MAVKFITIFILLAAANAGTISPAAYVTSPLFKYVNPDVNTVAVTQPNVIRSFDGSMASDSKPVDASYYRAHKINTGFDNKAYMPAIAKPVAYTAPIVTHNLVTPTFHSHSKTVSYAAPSTTKSIATPTIYTQAAPAVTKAILTPTTYGYEKKISYAVPFVTKSIATPTIYTQAVPAVTKTVVTPTNFGHTKTVAYAAPHATKSIATPTVYDHAAPVFTTKDYSQTSPVTYSQIAAPKAVAYHTPAVATSYNQGPDVTTHSHNAPGLSGYGSSQTIQYSPAEMVSHMSFDGFGTHWGY